MTRHEHECLDCEETWLCPMDEACPDAKEEYLWCEDCELGLKAPVEEGETP